MAAFTLIIGNKNYSSWSLRSWLVMKQAGLEFEEIRIPLDRPETRDRLLHYSPSGRVPVLQHGDLTIWESLAICEYLAELVPAAQLYPAAPDARAIARAVSCEMHAGFAKLRTHLPMDCRARHTDLGVAPQTCRQILTALRRFGASVASGLAAVETCCLAISALPMPCTPRWFPASSPTALRSIRFVKPTLMRCGHSRQCRIG